ncbi:MAG: hypothetical protein ACRDTD_26795 [Pseudonocardiaceae bacterium]
MLMWNTGETSRGTVWLARQQSATLTWRDRQTGAIGKWSLRWRNNIAAWKTAQRVRSSSSRRVEVQNLTKAWLARVADVSASQVRQLSQLAEAQFRSILGFAGVQCREFRETGDKQWGEASALAYRHREALRRYAVSWELRLETELFEERRGKESDLRRERDTIQRNHSLRRTLAGDRLVADRSRLFERQESERYETDRALVEAV